MNNTFRKIFVSVGAIFIVICCAWAVNENFSSRLSSAALYSSFQQFKIDDRSNAFMINHTFDLRGGLLILPQNAKLEFQGGKIINGTIKGDSTILIASKIPIFDNIVIEGSWKIPEITTDLFHTIDTMTASNISVLSSDKQYNKLTINHDLQVPIKAWSSCFVVKSNTDVVLNADLYTLPTNLKGGYCIQVEGKNINIIGNHHYLLGSLPSTEQKECYQWLHGLDISSKSSHVKINNLHAWFFCGDGFYNSGSNITFDNVDARFNGRQGMSITNGRDITIKNSTFIYTGYYRICTCNGPGAGIDIEPNDGDSVDNILIDNCLMLNNYRYMQGYVNDLEVYNAKKANISVTNCEIGGIYLGACSSINISNCIGINSVFGVNKDVRNVILTNCGQPLFSDSIKGLF